MVWFRAVLVGGLLLVLAAFAVGVEHSSSTVVGGQTQDCGSAISASWLVSGTPDVMTTQPAASADEGRAADECRAVVRRSRALVLTTTGLGGLLAVVGWTGVCRRREPVPPSTTLVQAGQP